MVVGDVTMILQDIGYEEMMRLIATAAAKPDRLREVLHYGGK